MRDTRETMRQARQALVLASVLTGLQIFLTFATLWVAARTVELAAATGWTTALLPLGVAIAGAIVCAGAAHVAVDRCLLRCGLWIDHVLEPRLLKAGLAEADPSRILLDTNRALSELRDFIVGRSARALLALPWLLAALAAIACLEPRVGLPALGIVALVTLLAAISARALVPGLATRAEAARQVRRGVVAAAETGHGLVGLGLARHACELAAATNRRWIAAAFGFGRRVSTIEAIAEALLLAGQIGIVVLALALVLTGEVTLVAALVLAVVTARLAGGVAGLPTLMLEVVAVRRAWAKLRQASLSEAAHRLFHGGHPSPDVAATLELADVDFVYPGADRPLLTHVSVVVRSGTIVSLVGAPGSGKSTIAALLAGGMLPTRGLAMLGGSPVAPQQSTTSKPRVGWLMQETILLDGTVAENITRFSGGHAEAVIACARRAGVYGVLATLPEGFATRVGPSGQHLSARQRRAVALARALYGNPAFLVLDEPELLLDARAIETLAETLGDLRSEGVGICLVTRDAALAALATTELLIADGHVGRALPALAWDATPANDVTATGDRSGMALVS